jgi:hypothetical protein
MSLGMGITLKDEIASIVKSINTYALNQREHPSASVTSKAIWIKLQESNPSLRSSPNKAVT